jgi:hypothetical protein
MKLAVPLSLAAFLAVPAVADPPAPKAKFTIGKETTYVTDPLDKDGYVDYAVALNERLGKGVTPETNAIVPIWKAVGPTPLGRKKLPATYSKLLGMDAPPDKGEYFVHPKQFVRDSGGSREDEETFEQHLTAALQSPWTEKDDLHLAAWLKVNQKPLTLLIEASKRPRYYSPIVAPDARKDVSILLSSPLADLGGNWYCRALVSRAMLKLADGKGADAWQDLIACHRLARLIAQGPGLIDAFIGIGIDGIASTGDVVLLDRGGLTPGQLRDCRKDLQGLSPLPPIADKFEFAARFLFLDSLQALLRGGPGSLLAGPDKNAEEKGRQKLAAIGWDPVLRDANARYDRIVKAIRMKDRAASTKEFGEIDDDFLARKKWLKDTDGLATLISDGAAPEGVVAKAVGDVLFGMTVQNYRAARQRGEGFEQTERNLRLAFALAAYRADHKSYPKALSDLVPKYLDKVPDDLFTGKPLVYRPAENGFLLYSLGPNGKDDDGRGPDDVPKGDDIAVRIPIQPPVKK